jgi:hypothetical protein
MKTYLVTTGVLFGVLTVLHVWRAIDEWTRSNIGLGFLLEMAALIALPGVFCCWACWLLRTLSDDRTKRGNLPPASEANKS